MEIGDIEPHYQLVVDRHDNLDDLEIWIEVSEKLFSDEVSGLEDLEHKIKEAIHSTLGISARIKLVEPKTIPGVKARPNASSTGAKSILHKQG